MRIWVLAGLGLAATLLAGGCAPGESSVAGPEGAGASAPPERAQRPTAQGVATPSGDKSGALTSGDRAAKSDGRSIAIMMETYYTDLQAYPSKLTERRTARGITIKFTDGVSAFDSVKLSRGTSASVRSDGQSYCITMTNPAATRPWIYESDAGGFQEASDAACDAEDGEPILGS